MGVSLTDLITLAKAGYTPGQVKELISLSETANEGKQEEPQAAAGATDEPKPASAEPKEASENKAPDEPEQGDVDYKKLYEQSQSDLKKAQEANTKKDSAPSQPEDPTKDLRAIIATYM